MDDSNPPPEKSKRSASFAAPAIILAVSLLSGTLSGRISHGFNPPWTAAALTAASLMAMVQPAPLALAAAGFLAGTTLESTRSRSMEIIPGSKDQDITLRGKVVEKKPALYGQCSVFLRATEVLGTGLSSVNTRIKLDLPFSGEIAKGDEVLVRTATKMTGHAKHSNILTGRTAADGWLPVTGSRSIVMQGRERLLRALDSCGDGPGSAIFGAVSLGERWRVDTKTREILKKTGTYHLVAISGVHVGAAIILLVFCMRLVGLTSQRVSPWTIRTAGLLLSCCTVGIYLDFAGFSSSALRASVYLFLTGASVSFGRSSFPLVSLAWCVVAITCLGSARQPDISLLLSALAVAGIALGLRGSTGFLEGMMRMTLGAVLFTLPVAVWVAGGISVIAPISNAAVALPFSLFLVPGAVLTDFASLLPMFPLESVLVIWLKAADVILALITVLAELPFSYLRLSSTGCLAASAASVAGLVVWMWKKYHPGVGLAVFLSVIILAECGHLAGAGFYSNDLVIDFPPVGQADAAIIRHQGRTILIDCGPPGAPGRDSPVARKLQKLGIRSIDAVFLSHLHPDHYGGINDILTMYPVRSIYLPAQNEIWRVGPDARAKVLQGSSLGSQRYGETVKISSINMTAIGPSPGGGMETDINRGSIHLLLEAGDFQGLFTGDAGWDQVQETMSRLWSLDLLKIPHHGSKVGFPPAGLGTTVARLMKYGDLAVVCPSDPPGRRPLPAPEVSQWFACRGIKLVYTGKYGVNIRLKKGGSRSPACTVVDNPNWF